VNWLGEGAFEQGGVREILVRVRSTRPPRPALLRPLPGNMAEVELLTPEEGVSPGQACVFYEPEGTRVLGGGWIWRG
jgi:tRNA-specific 2-thiouridylase